MYVCMYMHTQYIHSLFIHDKTIQIHIVCFCSQYLPLQPDPMSGSKPVGMFVAEGARWKVQRSSISPAFGVKRMKKVRIQ